MINMSRNNDSYFFLLTSVTCANTPSPTMRRRSLVVDTSSSGWSQMKDPKTGRVFYHNTTTGESSWERPAEHDNEWMVRRTTGCQGGVCVTAVCQGGLLFVREDYCLSGTTTVCQGLPLCVRDYCLAGRTTVWQGLHVLFLLFLSG